MHVHLLLCRVIEAAMWRPFTREDELLLNGSPDSWLVGWVYLQGTDAWAAACAAAQPRTAAIVRARASAWGTGACPAGCSFTAGRQPFALVLSP